MNEIVRVLHVIGSMNRGGAETFIMNVYREIDRSKLQFDFLISDPTKCDFEDEILSLGGIIHRMPRRTPNYLKHCKFIDSFFKNNKQYHIVHQHASSCAAISTLIYAKKNNVKKIIFHSHNSKSNGDFSDNLFNIIYKSKIRKYATHYFACSKAAGKNLFGKYIPEKEIQIINNGINVSEFAFDSKKRDKTRNEFGISNKFVVGHIGRFETQKNHSFLIDIFNEIYKQNHNAILILVGGGSLYKEIKYKVENLELKDSVIFTGVRSDIPELMCAMDVFVLPSLFEGLPVTLIETQANGLKSVVSDVVTTECKISEHIEFISLDEPSLVWASKIMRIDRYTREDMREKIKVAGFDIGEVVSHLSNIYTK